MGHSFNSNFVNTERTHGVRVQEYICGLIAMCQTQKRKGEIVNWITCFNVLVMSEYYLQSQIERYVPILSGQRATVSSFRLTMLQWCGSSVPSPDNNLSHYTLEIWTL